MKKRSWEFTYKRNDDGTYSAINKDGTPQARWTPSDERRLLELIKKHGKDAVKLTEEMNGKYSESKIRARVDRFKKQLEDNKLPSYLSTDTVLHEALKFSSRSKKYRAPYITCKLKIDKHFK